MPSSRASSDSAFEDGPGIGSANCPLEFLAAAPDEDLGEYHQPCFLGSRVPNPAHGLFEIQLLIVASKHLNGGSNELHAR